MLRFAAAIALALSGPAGAETISGPISVTDGDTFRIGDVRVRLHGIDAPEIGQSCELADGRGWACGDWAKQQTVLLFQGARAVCERLDTDRYGRAVARCHVNGVDMAQRLVSDGIAEAYRKYSTDYVDAEKAAFFAGRGLWRGRVQAPADYRAAAAPSAAAPKPECPIKGNISGSGRIYHLPGQEFYAATRISPAKGERWFCSEAQARAAGWRRARR